MCSPGVWCKHHLVAKRSSLVQGGGAILVSGVHIGTPVNECLQRLHIALLR